MRFRFLLDLLALLDRFVAMVIASFDLGLELPTSTTWPLLPLYSKYRNPRAKDDTPRVFVL
jgi:hypothetical protein